MSVSLTEQQMHLKNAMHQQRIYISEVAKLESILEVRKEQVSKLGGIIEYLTTLKVELPQEELDGIPSVEEILRGSTEETIPE